MTRTIDKDAAISKALGSVWPDRRLPAQIFVNRWDGYLFFYPTLMFSKEFVSVTSLLLKSEGSSVIALVNLGDMQVGNDCARKGNLLIDDTTTGEEYLLGLCGNGTPLSWLVLMDRYVCSSDSGSWSIYCEKQNDVAVIAWRGAAVGSVSALVESELKATSIDYIDFEQVDRFDFTDLIPEWQESLRRNYDLKYNP